MSAQPPQFDLGRSLTSALKALQQGPAAANPALPRMSEAKPASAGAPRPAADTAFQTKLAAALEAGEQGQNRPRGSFVNLSV